MPRIVSDGWACVVCGGADDPAGRHNVFNNGHKPRLSEFRPFISQAYLEKVRLKIMKGPQPGPECFSEWVCLPAPCRPLVGKTFNERQTPS